MSTLPTTTSFLPVLDDLLSPDFRTVSLPGQTPQTPAETPLSATATGITFGETHTGQLTAKSSSYSAPGVTKSEPQSNGNVGVKGIPHGHRHRSSSSSSSTHKESSKHSAALKIQKWWKVRKGKKLENGPVDIRAERAKHSVRHNRTDEHIRTLEAEVHRLKAALATERKLRSLQVEAIRSLWTQVQKVSSSSGGGGEQFSIMSQSMPNGLPIKDAANSSMSLSLHGPLGNLPKQNESQSQADLHCACTKEIQSLRESFSSEMMQLRTMIDHLKVEDGNKSGSSNSTGGDGEDSKVKRPLTLDLSGGKSAKVEEAVTEEEKKEISGYANQMANSIIEDAKEKEVTKE